MAMKKIKCPLSKGHSASRRDKNGRKDHDCNSEDNNREKDSSAAAKTSIAATEPTRRLYLGVPTWSQLDSGGVCSRDRVGSAIFTALVRKLPPGRSKMLLEVCIDSLASGLAAQKGGAQRVELCSSLIEGGVTPSAGVILQVCKELHIPTHVLIRPRGGDFLYSRDEFEVMKSDVRTAKDAGARGIVIGMLRADGSMDVERMQELVCLARPMRAIDVARDPLQILEECVKLGIDRILTSGQANSALQGVDIIRELVKRANNRLVILAGGGLTEDNIAKLIEKTAVEEVHASARSVVESQMIYRPDTPIFMGGEKMNSAYSEYQTKEATLERVQSFVIAMQSARQGMC